MSDTDINSSETENRSSLRSGEYCIVHETRRDRERKSKEENEAAPPPGTSTKERNHNNAPVDDDEEEEEAREQEERDKGFECAICLDIATEPVVTQCGHLFW